MSGLGLIAHPDTLASMNNLAMTYSKQGRWKEAEGLFVQVMETGKRVLGQEHPHTLISMNNLASTLRKQDRWKKVEELEVQLIETSFEGARSRESLHLDQHGKSCTYIQFPSQVPSDYAFFQIRRMLCGIFIFNLIWIVTVKNMHE